MSNFPWENPSLEAATGAVIADTVRQLRTAMPGRVVSFDPGSQTAVVQPMIRMLKADGTGVDLPPLGDVLVQFPESGGFAFTFPVEEGDEGLVVIADRCIDGWWQSGQPSDPMDFRLHDLSDGTFIPGINSLPNVIPGFDMNAIVMRKFDGSAYFKIDKGGNIEGDGTHMLIKCPATFEKLVTYQDGIAGKAGSNGNNLQGDFNVAGGDIKADDISLKKHRTSDVTPGSGTSGGPVP
ncbi:MAG: hypothetical protein KA735_04880 [Burkholderiaceae bacterium]|nr:hypothetical protein [Burkholderiaceae bacterium]